MRNEESNAIDMGLLRVLGVSCIRRRHEKRLQFLLCNTHTLETRIAVSMPRNENN